MTVEYLVLGIVLVVMGVVQVWLRHGPGAKGADSEGMDVEGKDAADRSEEGPSVEPRSPGRIRSGKAWDAWTAVLGGVGIAVGIALIVVGALGR